MQLIKKGTKGNGVKDLQTKIAKLGFDVTPDDDFGPKTEEAVKALQGMFGYTVDGIVGEGTMKLIDAQLGYGWNAKAPNAKELALKAQGKGADMKAPMTDKTAPMVDKMAMQKGADMKAPVKGEMPAKK